MVQLLNYVYYVVFLNIPHKTFIILCKKHLSFSEMELFGFFDELIKKYPNESDVYNYRSNYYREKGDYEKVLADIYKAFELNTESGVAYTTLAEIKFCQNDIQEFYRNFELALKYNVNVDYIFEDEEIQTIYESFYTNERFLKLLEKYDKQEALEKIGTLKQRDER